jgi:hypothetical protein
MVTAVAIIFISACLTREDFEQRTTSPSKVLERHWRSGGEYIFPRWRKFESQIAGGGSSSCSNKNRLELLPASSVFAHSFIRSKGYVFVSSLRSFRCYIRVSSIVKSLIGPLSTLSDGSNPQRYIEAITSCAFNSLMGCNEDVSFMRVWSRMKACIIVLVIVIVVVKMTVIMQAVMRIIFNKFLSLSFSWYLNKE